MAESHEAGLTGRLALLRDGRDAFSEAQVGLLEAIAQCGSITAAARREGISYKTAWDRIDAMNNLAAEPLVARSAGGKGGGGTRITDFGRRVIRGFRAVQAEHAGFVERLGAQVQELEDVAAFIGMRATSARNQYRGEVVRIVRGAVNAEVELRIAPQQSLVAIITNDSVDGLGLREGTPALALIKASWVLLSKDVEIATSARNRLVGTVARIVPGAVNADVTLDLGAGKSVCAIITQASVERLGLAEGDAACALIKASSVILARCS